MAVVAGNSGWGELLDDESLDTMALTWTREGLSGLPLEPMFIMVLEALHERLRWRAGLSLPRTSLWFTKTGNEKKYLPVRLLVDSDQTTVIESLIRPHAFPKERVDKVRTWQGAVNWLVVTDNPWTWLDLYANDVITNQGCAIGTSEEPPEFPNVYSGTNTYYLFTSFGWYTSTSGSGPWTLQTPGTGVYEWAYSYDPRSSLPRWWGSKFAFMLTPDTNQWELIYSSAGLNYRGIINTYTTSLDRWAVVPMNDGVFEARVENFDGDGNPPRNVYITKQFYDWKNIVSTQHPGDENVWTYAEMPFNFPEDVVPTNTKYVSLLSLRYASLMHRIGANLYNAAQGFVSPAFSGVGSLDGQSTDLDSVVDWALAQPITDEFDATMVFDAWRWDFHYTEDDTEVPSAPLTLWLKTVRTILDNCSAVIARNIDGGITSTWNQLVHKDWAVCRREPDGPGGELFKVEWTANSYPNPIYSFAAIQGREETPVSYVDTWVRYTVLGSTELTDIGGHGQQWMTTLDTEYYGVVDDALVRPHAGEWHEVPFGDVDGFLNGKVVDDFFYLGKFSNRVWSGLEESGTLPIVHPIPEVPPDPWDYTEPLSGYVVDTTGWQLHRFSDLPIYKGD